MGVSLPKAAARLDDVDIDTAAVAAEIESALRAVGTPERAEGEKAYLKSDLAFFGTTVWQIRTAVEDATRGKASSGLSPSTSAGWPRSCSSTFTPSS